jgi:hypothetical protein
MTRTPVTISSVLDSVVELSIPLVRDIILKLIMRALPTLVGTPWMTAILFVAGWIFDKFLVPLGKDLEMEAIVFVKKQELKRKVYRYEQAQTDQEFDDAFDTLIGSSKL